MFDQPLSSKTEALRTGLEGLRGKLRAYWILIKDLQTGLLLTTGLAGYMSGRPVRPTWATVISLLGSLFLTVGGSTVLNMVLDRDIDAKMTRTRHRPLPSGTVTPTAGLILGLAMAAVGILWAAAQSPMYALVVATGLLVDVLVYTYWLKRRTAWSVVWGGIAGGMPALAGRVLATGRIDAIGLWLTLSVLLWIPTHIMTFGIKYADDYRAAGVPIFPSCYGVPTTRTIIGVSTGGAVVTMLWAMYALDLNPLLMWVARGLGGILFGFTLFATLRPTDRLNFLLFKLASLYMLAAMIVIIAGA